MVTIAVDAMGGENAPECEVAGAVAAAKEHGVRVLLVGKREIVERELALQDGSGALPLEVVHASEVVTMEDAAAKSLLRKRDSSLRVAARLVKDGTAQGFVSAGNTGAVMATAKTTLGMIAGVDRPALASAMPTLTGKRAVLMDVGANVDCTPQMLVQFAVMSEVYSRVIFRTENPAIGLLSIGEEDHKGNELTKAALPLLKSLPLNFVGNVEGRDVYSGKVDVVVCDGFVGNVVLKVSEGLAEMVKQMLRESFTADPTRKLGYLMSKAAFADFRKRVDYSETGGAPLLGLKGVAIICHGNSNVNAVKNAIRIAAEFAEGKVNQQIEGELSRWKESQLTAKA